MHCSRLLLSFGLVFIAASASPRSYAIEDFRAAIKSIVPHIVLVRRLDQQAEKPQQSTKPDTDLASEDIVVDSEQSEGDEPQKSEPQTSAQDPNDKLLEVLRSRSESSAYQHAFRVAEDLVATVDLGNRSRDHKWELLSRDGQWHELKLVGRDNITRLVILRGSRELLDKIAATGPVEGGAEIGAWVSGDLEMGLPTVVVWYEDGGPRAKATMVAAKGNAATRGLAVLDFAFRRTQVGSPALDAQGRLLGVVSGQYARDSGADADRRFELSEVNLKLDLNDSNTASKQGIDGSTPVTPKAIIITADSRVESERSAEYIVPVEILDRLLSDISKSERQVILDYGLIGIRLGNGDATIRGIIRGGAAEEADCRRGDKIVSVDGESVRNDGDIMNLIMARRAGDTVTLELQAEPSTIPKETNSQSSNQPSGSENVDKLRIVKIKMRGLRTRSEEPSSEPQSGDVDARQSSLIDKVPETQVRLIGVLDGKKLAENAKEDQSERQDMMELRSEIEQLLKELSNQRKE